MIGFPRADASRTYDFMKPALKERDQDTSQFPAGYMFKDVPNKLESDADNDAKGVRPLDLPREIARFGADTRGGIGISIPV